MLIVGFWLAMTGLLIVREVFPEATRLNAVAVNYVGGLIFQHGQSSDLQIYDAGKEVGYLHIQPRPDLESKGGRILEYHGMITLNPLGMARQRLSSSGKFVLDTRHELKRLHVFLQPQETLLVADSATGQQAVSVAKHFDDAVGITGIILTKLDGDARGGAALSMRAVTGKPIKFAGEGEKLDQLFEFHPNRMADRILGMGDIVGMVEQVASKIDEKDAMKSMQRLAEGKFDFYDFLDQMKMLQKLGDMKGLLGLLPGFNKIKKQIPDAAFDPKRMKRTEAIVLSMTPDERRRPEIIKQSRRERIAKGSGTKLVEVNQLLKQFGEMRKMMRSPGKMNKMMKQMGGGMGGMPNLPGMGKGGLGGMDINEMMKSMKGKFPF